MLKIDFFKYLRPHFLGGWPAGRRGVCEAQAVLLNSSLQAEGLRAEIVIFSAMVLPDASATYFLAGVA
jgi:hypothetical protein